MNIVYIILVHKNANQSLRLINRLNVAGNSFVVHIDKKASNDIHQEISNFAKLKNNIYILKSEKIHWGGFSMVSVTIAALKEIFNKNIQFDYAKLLSGQDYPTKSNDRIKDFLLANQNKSFIEHYIIPSQYLEDLGEKNGGMDRIRYWYSSIQKNKYERLFKVGILDRKIPKNFQPFGGSQWWLLSRECAKYVHDFVIAEPKFTRFFKNVYIPDEIFFQTIIMNSYFKKQIINDNLTLIDWSINAAHPKTLTTEDRSMIRQNSCLFARKFDTSLDSKVLDLIDEDNILAYDIN